jgi:hypothetical protein
MIMTRSSEEKLADARRHLSSVVVIVCQRGERKPGSLQLEISCNRFGDRFTNLQPDTPVVATKKQTGTAEVARVTARRLRETYDSRLAGVYYTPHDMRERDEPGQPIVHFVAVIPNHDSIDGAGGQVSTNLSAEFDFEPAVHIRTARPDDETHRFAREEGVEI